MTESLIQETLQFSLVPTDNNKLANLCGVYDDNIKTIANLLDVKISRRGDKFKISGHGDLPNLARDVLKELYQNANEVLETDQLQKIVSMQTNNITRLSSSNKVLGVTAKNDAQAHYLNMIHNNDLIFGVGASGTGKTYLAVACALEALAKERVDKVVLVRPAVEAGEHLGFLPGDPVEKVNPYLRPLLDALHEISNSKQIDEQILHNRIELAPLAFMRGRTLKNSFVILDEAQNTTKSQMQMFLTRIGLGSRCVVTGDESQVDLQNDADSGLTDVLTKVANIERCAVVRFQADDTLRHPIVSKILKAYDQD